MFPITDGTAKLLGRDHELRESYLRQEQLGTMKFVRFLDRIQKITLLKENILKGYLWSGGRLTKVQATTGPVTVCGLKYGPKLGKPL